MLDSETVTVSGNGTYTTPSGYTLPTTGAVPGPTSGLPATTATPTTMLWRAIRAAEPVAVVLASPTIGTTANPPSVTLDSGGSPTLKDSATLAGGYNETGSITFTLYSPDDTTVLDSETVTVNGNATYSTPAGYTLPKTGTVIGTYQWVVSYNGDINNNGVTSGKGSEPVNVNGFVPTTVQDLVRLGYHDYPTRIVLTFTRPSTRVRRAIWPIISSLGCPRTTVVCRHPFPLRPRSTTPSRTPWNFDRTIDSTFIAGIG